METSGDTPQDLLRSRDHLDSPGQWGGSRVTVTRRRWIDQLDSNRLIASTSRRRVASMVSRSAARSRKVAQDTVPALMSARA